DAEKNYPIAILITTRPQGSRALNIEGIVQELKLGKLFPADLNTIAEDILGKPITHQLNKLLEARAEGNPFFVEQVLRYLQENELLTLNKENRFTASKQAEASLPADVFTVMIARLDRLTQQVRETVQTASVLGREFIVDVLAEMLRSVKDELPKYVYEAEEADIWVSLEEINYIFRHAMLRDAAYSMQLAARKTELHALACIAMEEVYQSDLEPYHSELAYHAEKGELKDKALLYLSLSGDHAMSTFLNHQAIDYFTRALAVLPEDDLQHEFDLLFKRVECAYNIGDSTAQLKDLDRLEEIAHSLSDNGLLARAFIRRAFRASILGDYKATTEYALQARDLAQTAGDTNSLLSVYITLPDALDHTGKLEEAKQSALDGIELARKLGNRSKEASGLSALGLVTLKLDGHAAARQHQEQSLEIAREIKDRYLEAKQLNNIALSIVSEGDYHLAREYFQQALRIFQEQGNQLGKSLAYANLGWLSSILGDYTKAMENYEHALVLAREQRAISEEMYTYINLSASAGGQGNSISAQEWARMALELSLQVKDHTAEAWAYFYLAHGELLAKDYTTAIESFQKSLNIRTEANILPLIVESRAGLVDAYWALGNQAAAEEEAKPIFDYMEKDSSFSGTEEPLRVYLSLYTHFEKIKDPRSSLVLQNANQLLEAQVSKLRSKEARKLFMENVPWRRALWEFTKRKY
ncbi:MAG TPA: tetratricopeptide repeat protein, partial [Anaerolineales bacterium]|nr:tetratricopeptide repeat protein [Anaerolineales bacterium]